ncbi:MAG: hypothetical protein NC120_13310 [Ruminococcus sp.]|nr:hypothetical protein [Ruminococcus sp.]
MYENRYDFEINAGKGHFEQLCLWVTAHGDKYALTEEKSDLCRCYKSENGKGLQVMLEDGRLTVASEDDLTEYFRKTEEVLSGRTDEAVYRSKENKAVLLLISLGFYTMEAVLPAVLCMCVYGLNGGSIAVFAVAVSAAMTLSHNKIAMRCGESARAGARTVIIQAGGVFALIAAAITVIGIVIIFLAAYISLDVFLIIANLYYGLYSVFGDIVFDIPAICIYAVICQILIFPSAFLLSEIFKYAITKFSKRQ